MSLLNEQQNTFIEELYRELFMQLNIFAQNVLRDRSLGEEAVQETFRIACLKIDELMVSDNPRGWLMNTLKNVISNIKRTRARWLKTVLMAAEIQETAFSSVHNEIDPNIMFRGMISAEEFDLLKKIVLEKYSMLEAADEFGISVDACKKRLQRVKEKLRKQLSE